MAVMEKPKSGTKITSWEYYVVGNEDWKRYEKILSVENKTKTPVVLFLDTSGKNVSKETYPNKTPVQLLDNKNYIIQGKMHAKVKIKNTIGYLQIKYLSKPPRNTTEKEDIALGQLDKEIKDRMVGGKGICIIIKSHGKVAFIFKDCTSARTISGTPKADFSIINSKGRNVAFISHKDAGGPSAYQQYVSVTGKNKDGINDHPILQNFLSHLIARQDEIVNEKKRFKKTVPVNKENSEFLNKCIYGMDYGKDFSKEHCHFIGQGKPTLVEAEPKDKPKDCGIVYELKFSDDLSISGDLSHFKNGGYVPIILARFTSGRNFYVDGYKYTGVRLLVGPTVLSTTAKEI
jgi:hypothetical protein